MARFAVPSSLRGAPTGFDPLSELARMILSGSPGQTKTPTLPSAPIFTNEPAGQHVHVQNAPQAAPTTQVLQRQQALEELLRHAQSLDGRFYHGTDARPFKQFDPAKIGSATDSGTMGAGFYFSTDPDVGKRSSRTLEASLSADNPLHVSYNGNKAKDVSDALGLPRTLAPRELADELRKRGYDSVVMDYANTGRPHQEVMVLDPADIHVVRQSTATRLLDRFRGRREA